MEEKNARVGVAVFVVKDGKFIMLQRQGSHAAGTWSLPGGHLEFGESFEQTAEREVEEETGLTINNIRFGGVTNDYFSNEDKHYVSIWLIADWVSGEATIVEPDKCQAMDWFTFDTLPSPLMEGWYEFLESEFVEKIKKEL